MPKPGYTKCEESVSSLAILFAFCLFSFAAVWAAPIPPTQPLAQIYLRYFTGVLAAASAWCAYKEWRAAEPIGNLRSWPNISPVCWPLLCVALAAWLRFRNLTFIDTWQDEDHQLSAVIVRDNLVALAATNHQAPLDYFNSRLMQKINGVSLFTARLWPAVWGSVAVLPFYRLLRNFVREESAVLGAVFFLGNALLWSLSQEGRPYMAAVFLFVVCLQMWAAYFREPGKRHRWVALVVAQAALSINLTMQPQLAFGIYFIPLVIFTLAGKPMRLKEYAAAVFLSGFLALPVMITAALELPEERQVQPFAAGFLLSFWSRMLEVVLTSLGPLVWAAPLLIFALFSKSRAPGQRVGKSLLALAVLYPFLFFFCFEAVLSTPVAPRYITFLVVLYIIGLTYSIDRLAPLKGYRYFAIVCCLLFLGRAVTAESLKEREPAWRQFFEYVSRNEHASGVGAVLDFPLDWPHPMQGFRGVYSYAYLYQGKLSIRSHSDHTLSATGDLIRRIKENPNAKFAYLFIPNRYPTNILYGLDIPSSPERKILRFDDGEAIRVEPKDNNLARALREALRAASRLEPRITEIRGFAELMVGFYTLENNCTAARGFWEKLPPPKQSYRHIKTFDYLRTLLADRCGPR